MLNNDIEASALLIYRHTQTGRLDMSAHSVMKAPNEGRFTLGAGRAFSEHDKESLVDILLNAESKIEFLDTKILVKSRTHLVWYTPPQKIDVLFTGCMFNAPIPGLVYIAQLGQPLRCFAFKGKARPKPSTPLFYAPFGNVYEAGTFCTGNVQVPKDNTLDSIPGWERFVLQCTNTHAGAVRVLKDYHSHEAMQAFYKELSVSGAKAFPAGQLVPVPHQRGEKFTLEVAVNKGAYQ